MADLGEDLELFEIFPRSPDTEIWYDARDVQAAPVDTQQSNDNVSNTSTTPDPDPVISEGSSRSSSAISHLWQRAVVFGEDPTMADILTFLGFPLVILGAWAAVQAIRMAQWTQWKDSFEWCENHNWTYAGCASLRNGHLTIPSGQPAMKRTITIPRIEGYNDTFPSGSSMPSISILGTSGSVGDPSCRYQEFDYVTWVNELCSSPLLRPCGFAGKDLNCSYCSCSLRLPEMLKGENLDMASSIMILRFLEAEHRTFQSEAENSFDREYDWEDWEDWERRWSGRCKDCYRRFLNQTKAAAKLKKLIDISKMLQPELEKSSLLVLSRMIVTEGTTESSHNSTGRSILGTHNEGIRKRLPDIRAKWAVRPE